jgi:hypothetical protein
MAGMAIQSFKVTRLVADSQTFLQDGLPLNRVFLMYRNPLSDLYDHVMFRRSTFLQAKIGRWPAVER